MNQQQKVRSITMLVFFWLFLFFCSQSWAALQCYDCHGSHNTSDIRPLDASSRDASTGGFPGNHRTHVPATAGQPACEVCHRGSSHYTSSHRDGKISLSPNINNSPATARYNNRTSAFPQTPTPTLGNCTNVNCHFESGSLALKWGSSYLASPAGCNACHGAPPSDGSHPAASGSGKKHGDYYKTDTSSCSKCHVDHTTEASPFGHASSARKRGLIIRFNQDAGSFGRYSGNVAYPNYLPSQNPSRNGTCLNVSCHLNTPAQWGGNLDCKGCHGKDPAPAFTSQAGEPNYANAGAGTTKANSHEKHAKQGAASCDACHTDTTTTGTTIKAGSTLHVNSAVDVTFNSTKAGAAAAWTAGTKTCSNIFCHNGSSAVWGGSQQADCTMCHGNDATSAHPMATGQHSSHVNNSATLGQNNNFACVECHANTVSDNRTIGTPANHANGLKNYSGAKAGRIAIAGSGSCSTVYCHSTGMKANQFWNMTAATWYSSRTLSCNGCHGTAALPDGTFTAFTSVAGEPNYANMTGVGQRNSHQKHVPKAGITDTTGCAKCHATTVNAAVPGLLRSYSTSHVNRVRDIAFSTTIQGRYSSTSQQCMNTYCHGTAATPPWGSASLACNQCHEANNALGGAHNKHWTSEITATSYTGAPGNKDATGATYQFECVSCHAAPASHANGTADTASGAVAQVYFGYTTAARKGTYSYGTSSTPDSRGFRFTSGVDQTCSTTYCHSDGNGGNGHTTALSWTSGASTLDCTPCHGGNASSSTPIATNAHGEHVSSYSYACDTCHNSTVNGSRTITNKYLHVNKSKDVALKAGGTYDNGTQVCSTTYCHSDALGRAPVQAMKWSDSGGTKCYSCHRGRTVDNTAAACADIGGSWINTRPDDPAKGVWICTPYVNMTSNGHGRLVGPQWIRKYPCYYCHNATVDTAGNILDKANHVNGVKDVVMAPQWAIVGRSAPTYNAATKVCDNVYCHSDGTTDPDDVRPFAWTAPKTSCNTCHGHPQGSCSIAGCHDGRTETIGTVVKVWSVKNGWPSGDEWKASMPMFPNQGAGTARANSHARHTETNFTCDICHASTIVNGKCTDCHAAGIPPGSMSEISHLNGVYHVNKTKDVVLRDGGSYDPVAKTCANTSCHTGGSDPVWGASVNNGVICLSCHGTTGPDIDSFGFFQGGVQTKINLTEWVTTGHGRQAAAGPYPASGNPAANFPGNPCWYCHDNTILHKDSANPFRLRQHVQFSNRFDEECVYCHMVGLDSECLGCHSNAESLAPQMSSTLVMTKHGGSPYTSGCRTASCHDTDAKLHQSGAGFWTAAQKTDVKNQYMMMGVCLKCHDDDSGGKCTGCHTAPANNPLKYTLGFDPGTGFIKPQKARASSVHFGYKHNRAFLQSGIWKGGKFCWDCHDPHGDKNIYMIQSQVATSTDGTFGIPQTRAAVSFTRKQSGLDYARTVAPYNGICNVCHSAGSQHYRSDSGDGHNSSRSCTACHEHRFADSHADNQPCGSCHMNKPVPRHSGFGLPRDCTKCHLGTINKRMDVMGQFGGTSHHIQGIAVTNKHCYACHWESTPDGLIDNNYHEGYNYKTYTSVKNAKVDLVVYGPGSRPTTYKLFTTAVQFVASNIGTVKERAESATVSVHCLSCHSDQNNSSQPFGDCRTPRQYAWDKQSVASRYSQQDTTKWGKYNSTTNNATKKDTVTKALSAHGNAIANQGGWSTATGVDEAIPNTRNGSANVQCFDCHSSHGSRLVGVTSSYVTFNGTKNGGNLKETQAGKGGYSMTYKATSYTSPGAPNPYNAGAGQCFDCHMTQSAGTTPWGYESTFGATAPIKGYFDSDRFGMGANGATVRYPYKEKPVKAGHLLGSSPLTNAAQGSIDGLCTPCHDPHGVSQSLGAKKEYAVPMLKGTWLSSPYKEDTANPAKGGGSPYVFTDQKTFGGGRITENDTKFAGLCLRCHPKNNLTDGTNKNQSWKSLDRVHESVKGWGANTQHSYPCSKCHTPHVTSLPRLMHTNCLDFTHQGQVASGSPDIEGACTGCNQGSGGPGSGSGSFPTGAYRANCHPTSEGWPNNYWNVKTPW